MLTFLKQLRSYVKNVQTRSLHKTSSSDKSLDFSQDSENPHISLSQSSAVPNVDTSMKHFSQKKEKHWIKYPGLQGEIYDTEGPK